MSEHALAVLGIIIGLGGIGATIIVWLIQERRLQKLKERDRTDAWHLYGTSFRLWARLETLKNRIEKAEEPGQPLAPAPVLSGIGESYGIAVDLCRDTIRLIKQSEPEFNAAKIDRWAREQKIPNPTQQQLFTRLLNT